MLTIGKTLTPQQRLTKNVIDIMGHPRYIALGGVLMIGERTVESCPPMHTACTNGRDEKYDPMFVDTLTDAELRFVILHENGHKMYRHLTTWSWMWDINPYIANMACDHVLNLQIVEENSMDGFAKMPNIKGVCYDRRFVGMAASQVFKILCDEQEQQQQEQGGAGAGGTGIDQHDWEDAKDMSDDEKRELAQEIDQAIRQGVLAASKTGTGGDINKNILDMLKPQVDWRQVLREFIKDTYKGNDYSTYARPNRRYISSGIYMPTGLSDKMGELVIAPDMSGSTGIGKVRNAFMTEAQEACNLVTPSKVRLLYWDTRVTQEEVYEGEDVKTFATSTTPKGGGGTTVACIPAHLAQNDIKPQAVIVLTDGDLYGGDWGKWDCPVLWVIVDHPTCYAPYGKTLHVDSTLEG
jgi:predicted metal-dependent peptidase